MKEIQVIERELEDTKKVAEIYKKFEDAGLSWYDIGILIDDEINAEDILQRLRSMKWEILKQRKIDKVLEKLDI